ncbi:unnamed protein product [Adineta steineri]|uniref:Uncharacterized protein n=1 Tax=Adineta steineri TaxID=433720 RepID=A0A815DXZ2_9BILA|nr:unnamed protein product [Adineta steineri]CAF1304662.1 unnamed protein product [Adineta steineri]CAF1577236.1 unnamed protein product [Adineta steineri]CAF1577314.1 unnamed protein product [Adineta steineri]
MLLTGTLVSDLSAYAQKDYRRFLSAHLQFLTDLCQLSKDTINISIQRFLSSLLLTTELLSETNFRKLINATIKQNQLSAAKTFIRLLSLIRSINDGNAIISTYGTNFEYIFPWEDLSETYAPTRALIYDNECSCGLSSNCTTQANFIETNSSKINLIKGLKMGCKPIYSTTTTTTTTTVYVSTNITTSIMFNSTTNTKSTTRTTQNPTCLLNYQRVPVKRPPAPLANAGTYAIADFNGDGWVDVVFSADYYLYVLLGIGIGIFEQYTRLDMFFGDVSSILVDHFDNDNTLDLVVTSYTLKTADILLGYGNGRFRKTATFNTSARYYSLKTTAVADFDGDTYLDIAVTNALDNTVSVLFGEGNGYFSNPIKFYTGVHSNIGEVAVADLNCDGHQDIAVVNVFGRNIGIFLNYGNGTFQAQKTSFTGGRYDPYRFVIADFNSDLFPDIVVTYRDQNFIKVIFGYGNATVGNSKIFQLANYTLETKLFVRDFNNDHYLDIGFNNNRGSLIALIGDGHGNFEKQTLFTMGPNLPLKVIALLDFNNDGYQDMFCVEGRTTIETIFMSTCA